MLHQPAQLGNSRIAAALELKRPWKILKRGKDETPLNVKDSESGSLETCRILNAKIDLRWGEADSMQASAPMLPCEMAQPDTDGLSPN